MTTRIGEVFILGFRGKTIPPWLLEFESKHGLGGVILFDFNCQTGKYDNNIESPTQLKELCHQIRELPSRPLLFLDQEGGKVRRLKEGLGFAPMPSALAFASLPASKRLAIATRSFEELRDLGFHFNLAPVVDLNYNPRNPSIGAYERSFSRNPDEVAENVSILCKAALAAGIGLCVKHYPGLGGASVDSHLELTDLTGTVEREQLDLFVRSARQIPGQAILVSHGLVRDWDPSFPVSMMPYALRRLRERIPQVLLISDDLQMQGLQKRLPTQAACVQGIRAGIDLLCIGNNLMAEDERLLPIASHLESLLSTDEVFQERFLKASARIAKRKKEFGAHPS
jgi:beta-N-acetylhexosaminidase